MQLLRNNSPRQRGFTLFELLAVTTIIAIVAALLLTAVTGTRGRSMGVQCLNNVRQLGLAMGSFVAQNAAYPLYLNHLGSRSLYPEHRSSWISAISPEAGVELGGTPGQTGAALSSGIWDCPAGAKPKDRKPSEGYADYGYNAYGVGDPTPNNSLGLGGHVLAPDSRRPVKESEVVAPSSTYALGDGFVGNDKTVSDGRSLLWRRQAETEFHPGSAKRSQRRHAGKSNIAFADGHVEAVPLKILFVERSDAALSRWNYDHQPHRDRLSQ